MKQRLQTSARPSRTSKRWIIIRVAAGVAIASLIAVTGSALASGGQGATAPTVSNVVASSTGPSWQLTGTIASQVTPGTGSTTYYAQINTGGGWTGFACAGDAGSGSNPVPVACPQLGGFAINPGQTVQLRFVTQDASGHVVNGTSSAFTAPGLIGVSRPIGAYTNFAGTVSNATAASLDSPSYTIQYGPTTAYGSTASASACALQPSDSSGTNYCASLSLASGTYHYRVVGSANNGVSYSDDMTAIVP